VTVAEFAADFFWLVEEFLNRFNRIPPPALLASFPLVSSAVLKKLLK
jgi:hypothetical protein